MSKLLCNRLRASQIDVDVNGASLKLVMRNQIILDWLLPVRPLCRLCKAHCVNAIDGEQRKSDKKSYKLVVTGCHCSAE